jgi:hypothetical protein
MAASQARAAAAWRHCRGRKHDAKGRPCILSFGALCTAADSQPDQPALYAAPRNNVARANCTRGQYRPDDPGAKMPKKRVVIWGSVSAVGASPCSKSNGSGTEGRMDFGTGDRRHRCHDRGDDVRCPRYAPRWPGRGAHGRSRRRILVRGIRPQQPQELRLLDFRPVPQSRRPDRGHMPAQSCGAPHPR